jgi:hypothetical protein
LTLLGGLAVLFLGCQREDVSEYEVPRDEPTVRLLGAIVPHGDDVWFLKLAGPLSAVGDQKAAFEQFARSLHFGDGKAEPVKWALPPGWAEEKGPAPRYATIKLGPKDGPLELTVTRLDNKGKAADVLENVNRWRKLDLGLTAPLAEEDLPQVIREEKVSGQVVTLVEATGPGAPVRTRPTGPMEGMGPRPARGARPSFQYDVPEGWQRADTSGSLVPIDLKFVIKDKDTNQTAEMTVSSAGGDLESNVVRWGSQQLHIPGFGPAEARKAMRPGTVDRFPAHLVDLEAPADQGERRPRILGAVVERDGALWFFKLRGPHALIGRQEANFKAFLDSFKFDGGR